MDYWFSKETLRKRSENTLGINKNQEIPSSGGIVLLSSKNKLVRLVNNSFPPSEQENTHLTFSTLISPHFTLYETTYCRAEISDMFFKILVDILTEFPKLA